MNALNLKPKKADKLANQLYEQILDWIISGMLSEGDKLPSENELCKSFQVSRPIVREAMLKLQTDALVETKKGIGTFVLHSPSKGLSKFASTDDIAVIMQNHEVRIALEGEAAALAASRRTPAQLQFIKDALDTMRSDFEASNLSVKPDYDFHLGVAQATNNDIFVQLLGDLHVGLKKTMAIAQSLSRVSVKSNISPDRNKQVLEEHQKIVDAIELQDEESARLAMRYHISKIKQRITSIQKK